MSDKVEALSTAIRDLPREDAWELHEWLADYLEDELELQPSFVESIERGKRDISAGRTRIRKPDSD